MLSKPDHRKALAKLFSVAVSASAGKTGTAELDSLRADGGKQKHDVVRLVSPYESPRYAVVVMVEDGASGGGTCAPIAHDVYKALDGV